MISSQRQLNLVRAQVTSKEREQKMHALTRKQVEDEQSGKTGPFYRAVGKMFISEDPKILTAEMAKKEKEAADEIANLFKKQKVSGVHRASFVHASLGPRCSAELTSHTPCATQSSSRSNSPSRKGISGTSSRARSRRKRPLLHESSNPDYLTVFLYHRIGARLVYAKGHCWRRTLRIEECKFVRVWVC